MARAHCVGEESFLSQVERVRSEIETKFLRVHRILQVREADLLAELQRLVDEYTEDGITQQIEQLSDTIGDLFISLKGNENIEILHQSVVPIHARIHDLEEKHKKIKSTFKRVSFEWDAELDKKLSVAGDLRLNAVKIRNYKKIEEPIKVFGTHSEEISPPGVFRYPVGITINPETNFIYICDQGNNRVQVYNPSLEFVFLFNKRMDGPYGICIKQNKVYVAQSGLNCLNVYTTEGNNVKSVGVRGNGKLEFDKPRGLDVSSGKDRIYIAEFENDRVQCLNLDLTFNSFIDHIYGARDVKLTSNEIIVLSLQNPCVSLYTYSHQLIREMIPRGEGYPVVTPCFVSIDESLNILITDFAHHCVYVFSFEGVLIHKFGKVGKRRGNFIDPRGIAIDVEGRILVASKNPNSCIQVF